MFKKFIEDWKFRYSIFNAREKIIVSSVIGLLGISTIALPGTIASAIIDEIKLGPTYDVVLEAGPGELSKPEQFESLKSKESIAVELPTAKHFKESDSLIFDGWTMNGVKYENEFFPKENSKLIAKWISVTYKDEVKPLVVNYEIVEKDSDDLLVGNTKIEVTGINGEIEQIFRSKYHDDVLIDTVIHKETVKVAVVNEVVVKGTQVPVVAQAPATTPNSNNVAKPTPPPSTNNEVVSPPVSEKPPVSGNGGGNYTPTHDVPVIPNDFKDNFANCTELNSVYNTGVPKGHPAYRNKMDRDKDNWACEVR